MKNNLSAYLSLIVLVLLCMHTSAQSTKQLLSIESIGGNQEDWPNLIKGTYDGGFILPINTKSFSGNMNVSCNPGGVTSMVYRVFDAKGKMDRDICRFKPSLLTFAFPMADGNIMFFGGQAIGANSLDYWYVEKEKSNGAVLVSKNLGSPGNDRLLNVIPTIDSGFITIGETDSYGDDVVLGPADTPKVKHNIWVVKLDKDANIVWSKVIGGSSTDLGVDVAHGPDGGFYIIANSISTDYDCPCQGNKFDVYVARLNSKGDILWSRCMGGQDGDVYARDITEDGKGGAYILATARTGGRDLSGVHIGKDDFWVVHLDSNNNRLLNKCYGSVDGRETPSSIEYAADGTIWVAGISAGQGGDVDTAYGANDIWVFNIDETGAILYSKVLGTASIETANSIHAMADSSVVVAGHYAKQGTNPKEFPTILHGKADVYLAKFGYGTATSVHNTIADLKGISVYPNPVNDVLSVTLDNEYILAVINTAGAMLYSSSLHAGSHQIDMRKWSTGVYILSMQDTEGRTYYKKLLKM